MKKMSRVAIVGRMNVGKSTLFNRLAPRARSLTLNYEGVTRDEITDLVDWKGHIFELVDTGGVATIAREDALLESVRQRVWQIIDAAELIVFVVDGAAGVMLEDESISAELRKRNKRVILAVNKEDTRAAQEQFFEFASLYSEEQLSISAQHGTGMTDLLDKVIELLPNQPEAELPERAECRVAFIGRPNVGKSSLLNMLLEDERALVSDIPGTTREPVSGAIRFYQETLQLTDTPGIRRQRAIDEELEELMVKSSFAAVRDAQIVLLLLDGSQGAFVDQELKLAFYAFNDLSKSLIILINKSDLMDEAARASLETTFEEYGHLMGRVERLFISCKSGKNVGKILPLIQKVWQRTSQQLHGEELALTLIDAFRRTPIIKCQQKLQVSKVQQVNSAPITIVLRTNHPQWFEDSQKRFAENVLRKTFDLVSVPIKFIVR
ncbi:MAG: GTPase Der [candidate division TM6 bacterium GW2011_GWF2_43_17]|nr:MAG: GTPase Der [candidate division TM6 bacterium GW2011_GWF2_43_17]HAU30479.1 ribosome biogenesis GTPase Der [Candidatus Dependentiae bacterium]